MDQTLEQRLKRLMLMRLVMVTTLLLIAAYVEAGSERLLPVNPLYFLIGATYGLTVLHALALRFLPWLGVQVYAQVIGDLLIITGLVYATGGIRTGFMLLYPIPVLWGSVMLYRGKGLALAGLATVFYAAMLLAVRLGWVPVQGLSDVPFLPARHLYYSVFVTGVACATVAMIGAYLSQSLKTAGERLEEATEQVADLQELNKVIVDSIHSGLIITDAAGRVLYHNRFAESILGRRAAEVRGRTLREVFGSWLIDAPTLRARVANEQLNRFVTPYTHPDGSTRELGVSVSSLATSDPGRAGHLLVFQDLTEIRRLEQEVQVKEKLAAVGEMAAHLAHEIRNPLGSISGSAQVLMAEANISPEQERLLGIITRESRRLSDALSRFLLQTRASPSPASPVDIGPLIAEAVTLLRNSPEVSPQHSVEFQQDDGPHVCLADPDQIVQVFWNLVRNGLEAMPHGGRLEVHLSRAGADVVLAVRDQGRGIMGDEQRRVFEPFHSTRPMGTGLGLAIVYRIVREHRGDITLRSMPPQGTVVEVRLPLVPLAVPA